MEQKEELKILRDNLRIFSERTAISEKQRELSLEQWLHSFLTEQPATLSELYEQFCEIFPHGDQFNTVARAKFCAHLAKIPAYQKMLSAQTGFRDQEVALSGSYGKIAMVRNRYNEEAFSVFESFVQGAKADFFPSFADACEAVFDNLCEFCLLPIENTENGRLFGFYAMLDRYELRICASCSLEHEDSPDTVRYALVGKHLPKRIPKNALWNLEYCVFAEAEEFPYDIFQVAPIFEATPIKIDSLPMPYDDVAHRIYFTFRIPITMAYAFDLYLLSEHPRYTPIGLYPLSETMNNTNKENL